ncbi:MAG: peptide deformylase [Patescibacteria group bacterium]
MRRQAKKIVKVESYQVEKLIDNLKILMREKDLIGIAAPQIGVG